MDTGRLGIVRRQENSRRKFAFMLNDVIKSQCDVSERLLKREGFKTRVKFDRSLVYVRRSIVKQRVLQHCLRMKCRFSSSKKENLGAYGGKPLYAFSRDIDRVITYMHPRRRRMRETDEALRKSIEKGQILDPLTIPEKIDNYFKKLNNGSKNVEMRTKPIEDLTMNDKLVKMSNNLPPIYGLFSHNQTQKYSDDKHNVENKDSNELKDKHVLSVITKTQSLKSPADKSLPHRLKQGIRSSQDSSKRDLSRESSKGLLILPPIQQTKHMIRR